MEPHINSHMEFTWKIDKRSRINGLHDFDSHMENKYIMCIIDKIAILSIMVARFFLTKYRDVWNNNCEQKRFKHLLSMFRHRLSLNPCLVAMRGRRDALVNRSIPLEMRPANIPLVGFFCGRCR